MKRSFFNRPLKQALLAVPAAALMLGAAQAGTTVGLNFQTWYYNSGANPQTVGFGSGYQTTGFPVTAKAFGVDAVNWFNTDPLPAQAAISGLATFGGVNTTFAGGLSANMTAPNAWQSGIGEQVTSSFPGGPPETVAPGNNEVTWGYLDSGATQSPNVTISGLAAKFPNGYVIQTIAAENGNTGFEHVQISDGVTTNRVAYSTYFVSNPANDGYDFGGTVGVSAPSGVFTSDSINLNCEIQTAGNRSTLAGIIITDKPVVSQDPVSATYVTGQSITLSASVIGLPTLSYQWRSNGIPITGANLATYNIPSAPTGSFNYDVIATNLYGSATSAVALVQVVVPATLTWDANTGTSGAQDGAGNWDNGTTANWWNGSSDVVWGTLDSAVFGAGNASPFTVTVTTNVAVGSLTFNSGNYTLAGTGITLGGAAIITANSNATISLPLAGFVNVAKNGTGTLTLTGNNTFSGNLVVNGGIVQGGATQGSSYLGAVSGGRTISIASGASIIISNNNVFNGAGQSSASVPAVVINGGTFNSTRYNSIGNLTLNSGAVLSQSASDAGAYQGYQFLGNITTGGSSASTISTGNNKADHLLGAGVNIITVADATGDANPDLIISAPLIDGSGDYLGAGSIVKSGVGTLLLSGVNTYTGTTTVSNGTLSVSGQLNGTAAVTLNDSTTLNVTIGASAAINTTSLTLGMSGAGADTLGFANLNSSAPVPISVSTSLTVNNPVTVNITGVITTTGSYPLISYGAESGSGSITLGSLPSGVSATLVDDHLSTVSLNVTATPVQTETWNGTPNGNWDINNTANWLVGATPSKWAEANIASFGDTAAGTTAITLNTIVHPSIVTFNNSSKNYSFSGTGSIAGAVGLTLNGSGTVTLGTSNTYSGGILFNAGTLSVSSDANLGTGALTFNAGVLDITGSTAFASGKNVTLNSGGTIQVDNTAGASFSSVITGGGALTKSGNGTLAFSAQQTYVGGTTINGGILDLTGGGGAAGTIRGIVTINAGGTMRLSTGDAVGYQAGLNNLNTINITAGGTMNINSTANQTLGSATVNLTGGAITGVPAGNLDFFGGSSALNTVASPVTATISGSTISPLRQGSTTFDVQAGTTPSGIDLDISSVLRANGDPAGSVLVKADSGTMRLSAVNTYQGGTEISGGTLILTGRLIGGGYVQVDDGATLKVSGAGVNSAILAPTNSLNLGNFGLVTMGFNNVNSASVPIVSVSNVVVNVAVTVNISGNVPVGQFPLIKYGGTKTGAGSFALGTLPASVSATLVDNVGNQSVDLLVTSAPLSIITDISSGTNFAYAGANYSLTVVAGGNPTLGYHWNKNGAPISGATTATLTLTRLTAADAGNYNVVVTNSSGSISSSTNHLVVLPDSGYTALTIATGPVAFWPLDELAGPTATDDMGGHNGSYVGTVAFGVPGAISGAAGTGTAITASAGNYVTVPYGTDINPSGPFTVEAWFNPSAQAGAGFFVCPIASAEFGANRKGWLIYQSPTGWNFRTYNANGATTAVSITGSAVVVGAWTHLVCVWDGTFGYLYENGVLKATSAATTYFPTTSANFTLGARSDGAFYLNGTSPGVISVDDVAFYSRALTPQEIKSHAQNSPILQLARSGGNVVLSWVPAGGTLVGSPTLNGTYTNIPAATTPWTNAPSGTEFFRVKF